MSKPRPHPANVPGDFYVEDNCCTMCGVPFVEAAGLFGMVTDADGYEQCYVKRQPETPGELTQMIKAIWAAEFRCIRYRGRDRLVQERLIQIGEREVCDEPLEDR